jgi:hypothetical protein
MTNETLIQLMKMQSENLIESVAALEQQLQTMLTMVNELQKLLKEREQ